MVFSQDLQHGQGNNWKEYLGDERIIKLLALYALYAVLL